MADYFFPLVKREEVAEETMAFYFATEGSDFTYKAGQYCAFELIDPPYTDNQGTIREFSLASSPHESGHIMVATRMRDTAFKNALKEIPLGTKVKVTGPIGSLTLHKDDTKPAVFLGGGIGITPMRSIIGFATNQKLSHRLYLFYSNRSPKATAFLSDFEQWTKENPNFTFVPTVTDTANDPSWHYGYGRIDAQLIEKHLPEFKKAIYYIAGPARMVSAMRELLEQMDVPEEYVKSEDFVGY
jgi:ferredoxin-NADP reductase